MTPPKQKATKQTKLKILHRRWTNIFGSAHFIKSFDDDFDSTKLAQVPIRIQRLDALWREFEETQEEIELLEDGEEDFAEERQEFQALYYELKTSLQSKIPVQPPVPPPAPVQPISSAIPISSSVRLPEIKLKEFSGNLDDWVSFRDLYVSLIHTSIQLTAVQKMHYLRATLSGEAARIISSLEISANNYLVAWKLLKERFENPNLLVKRHVSALLMISSLKKESAQGLADLADEFDRHVQLLDKLEDSENHWNAFLVERLSQCLDAVSLREWETHVSENNRYPMYQELLEFIHRRSRIVQTLKLSQSATTQSEIKHLKSRSVVAHVVSDNVPLCVSCKQAHFLFQCEQFRTLSPQQRFEVVKRHGLCINCLKGKHHAKNCSSGACKNCSKKHHSLLHLPPLSSASGSQPAATVKQPSWTSKSTVTSTSQTCQMSHFVPDFIESSPSEELVVASPPGTSGLSQSSRGQTFPKSSVSRVDFIPPPTACQSAELFTQPRQSTVILSTAVIKVKDADNNYVLTRALLDSGSQPSFISEALCQRLRLPRTKLNSPVSGIGQSVVNVRYAVSLSLASRFENFSTQLDCLVLPKLTVSLPSHHIDVSRWRIPRNLPLADPQFNISQGVDMIIGAGLFFELLENQQLFLAAGYPTQQKTVLGYIVCGKLEQPKTNATGTQSCHICVEDSLDTQLQRFWEIENFDDGKALTPDENFCEEYFQSTVVRDNTGRYVVRLPLRKDKVLLLGDSYPAALRRFQQMEKRFLADEKLRQDYSEFMEQYERLGHMELSTVASSGPQYFLPHHAIHRPESTTTKIRVVFDGSCRGATSLSLNDALYVGPTVQPALFTIVVNFRLPLFAITADAEKMFRQISVHLDDRKFQQVLWRKKPSEPIRKYQLKTVTYGLASSPFHAARILNQLAIDEGHRFPLAVPVLLKGTYVDDVISGHDDHDTMTETCKQLMEMMKSAGFVLRKWASNHKTVLSSVPEALWETSTELELDRSQAVKTLGLLWFPLRDVFKFKVPELPDLEVVTKRIVVSEMSQLFDPLGLLGPVVVNAKMFIQTLWAANMSWDSELAEEPATWWKRYRADIKKLNSLQVPRRVVCNTKRQYSLHCFCDASQKGYGCCVYIVSKDELGQLHSHLLTSKSRVAPLRGQSIPRLELCAALLGCQLVHNLLTNTDITGPVTFWTDSTVALHWIKSRSNSWKVFVSNRVAEIQRLTKDSQWMHVPTDLNPADHISRGVLASQIINDSLWWHGPQYLTSPVELWPKCVVSIPIKSDLEEEMRPLVSLHLLQDKTTIFSEFSELAKLTRFVAYCFRFRNNCKLPKTQRVLSPLSPEEFDYALKALIRLAQHQEFPTEVHSYRQKQSENAARLAPKSPLKNLNIFMDEFGLLRIDGRLKNLNAPFDTRHPILLPARHTLSFLIAKSIHLQTLHGGPSLLLATVRQRFWPLRGRDLARKVVRQCITCFRCNPTTSNQIMAPLPSVRLRPARAFTYSGMDYCGPFLVRPLIGKGSSVKVYIALFVCMVVKAVHLEVVADLSSAACINAVKRFIAKRGRVLELHCDNATAFVGADRELRILRKEYLQQFQSTKWGNYCAGNGITFRFIPARSPHFGGIWEAGVKSFKYHFRRIMGQKAFTMDQLLTVVAQVESVLNSRPLVPISDSPDDLSALTPGHFLIGEPLVSIPEPDLLPQSPNRITRLQDMQRSVQDLWRCWSRDYVSQLHQRSKWRRPAVDVRKGQLVLLKQENCPPLQWPLGRIIETIPDPDGRVRVVVVRTASNDYKRAVTEIAVLPIDSGDEEDSSAATSTGDVVVG
ncbi:uncharacterized protein LOC129774549 [Toxorhynchites rutilus septentrionalis]|uniref:uncharacterized protein LOC129774549 n=1 Tax=Toxorhynchites rutilus septentrionalis TaxID=329112 RepID=UPI00247ABEA2|nr:uncharacterized protein LOC129774549 [Toxorhynchites rutilus septentrionalis]